MKIRTLVSLAGAEPFNGQIGAEVEVSADEAARLIEAGYAEPVEEIDITTHDDVGVQVFLNPETGKKRRKKAS